jgi:DNA-directed RNA polymerase specialized sigma24 family protein
LSDDRAAVWAALLTCRERATRVALARGAHRDDVDDIVQEALTRVAAMPHVDLTRVGALVTVIVSNLVADSYRLAARTARAAARLAPAPWTESPDEHILDVAEARWLWSRRRELGDQDRRVFELRTRGLSVAATASELGVTYKAAETAFTRARTRMKTVWRATAALIGGFAAAGWRRMRPTAAGAVAITIATLVLGLVPAFIGATRSPAAAQPTDGTALRAEITLSTPSPTPRRTNVPQPRQRPAPRGPSSAVQEAATGPLTVGDLGASGVTLRKRHPEETLPQTLERCLRAGVEVTPTHVRCREDQGAGTQYSPPGQIVVGP